MSDDNDKIKSITTEQDKLLGNLENLKRNMSAMIEMQKIMAKLKKASYDAYVDEGFSEAQALELCKQGLV